MEELKKKASLNALTHISDEPTIDNADTYQKGFHMRPYIGDVPVIDALSHVQIFLYEEGIVKKPVLPANISMTSWIRT